MWRLAWIFPLIFSRHLLMLADYTHEKDTIASLFLIYRALHFIKELSSFERPMRVSTLSYLQFSPSTRIGFSSYGYIFPMCCKYRTHTRQWRMSRWHFCIRLFHDNLAFPHTISQFRWRIGITISHRLIDGCQFKDIYASIQRYNTRWNNENITGGRWKILYADDFVKIEIRHKFARSIHVGVGI